MPWSFSSNCDTVADCLLMISVSSNSPKMANRSTLSFLVIKRIVNREISGFLSIVSIIFFFLSKWSTGTVKECGDVSLGLL